MLLHIYCDASAVPIQAEPGTIARGFQEGAIYRIACDGAGSQLLVDEEQLPVIVHAGQHYWRWMPGFYAGQVSVELRTVDGIASGQYLFDVSPNENKLGNSEFAAMVEELATFRQALLLGTEPSRISIGAEGEFVSLNLQYGRLRQYGETFCQALRRIKERPIRKVLHTRSMVPAYRAKRIDYQTALACARSPASAQLKLRERAAPSTARPILDVPSYTETTDVPANQTLSYFLIAVLARIRSVTQQLEQQSTRSESNSARTELAARWPERSRILNNLERRILGISRCSPFVDVSRREITVAGLNAISASPLYGRGHRLAWQILRTGISGEAISESQWMSPSWEIYERWCYLQVARIIAEIQDVAEDQIDFRYSGEDSILASIKNDKSIFEVRLQDTFPSYSSKTAAGKYSISGQRCPDITVVHKKLDGSLISWLCLDAKYRISRQGILDAMSSAHIYHDALRLDDFPPTFALLLTPAPAEAGWLMEDEFIGREKVGVISTKHTPALRAFLILMCNCGSEKYPPPK